MPAFLTLHTVAALEASEVERLVARLRGDPRVRLEWAGLDRGEGLLACRFQAPGREELEGWLRDRRLPHDQLLALDQEYAG